MNKNPSQLIMSQSIFHARPLDKLCICHQMPTKRCVKNMDTYLPLLLCPPCPPPPSSSLMLQASFLFAFHKQIELSAKAKNMQKLEWNIEKQQQHNLHKKSTHIDQKKNNKNFLLKTSAPINQKLVWSAEVRRGENFFYKDRFLKGPI